MINFLKKIIRRILNINEVYIDDYKKLIAQYIPKNPVILEAGACDGKDTLQMATFWKNAVIYSFEPIPELFEQTKIKLKSKKNVHLFPMALSNVTGEVEINVSSGLSNGSSSILAPFKHLEMHAEVLFNTKIKTQAITLKDWSEKHFVSKIDLIWLDMQGMEFKVLEAGQEILKNTTAVFTEVSLIETYHGVMLYPEFRLWMEDRGFKVIFEDLPYKDMGNVLFVRK